MIPTFPPGAPTIYAVVESLSRIVANGGDYSKVRFTFQEYFRRMSEEPSRWSQPFAALLGAYDAQLGFGLPSIGGKDSMSGTFNEIDVPPTLVSFAVDVAKSGQVMTPELKQPGDKLVLFELEKDDFDIPVYEDVMALYEQIQKLIWEKTAVAAYVTDAKGVAAAMSKMAFGNKLGVKVESDVDVEELFENQIGAFLLEIPADKLSLLEERDLDYRVMGTVTEEPAFVVGDVTIPMEEALKSWTSKLEKVFPTKAVKEATPVEEKLYQASTVYVCKNKVAKPNVFIPVFPGTNCEYDSAKAFERAGAEVTTKVFKNLTAEDIRSSVDEFEKAISQAQIIMFPGGFSAGDEPDGSAKFFATAFQNAKIKEAVMKLLNERDGLALGICNGSRH